MKLYTPAYFRRTLELKRQPAGSSLCGHCCVAMTAGVSVHKAVETIGHRKGTRWPDVIKALRILKIDCPNRARRINALPKPPFCIVLLRSKRDKKFGHFCVYSHGAWFDPGYGFCKERRHHKWEPHIYPVSFLAIL